MTLLGRDGEQRLITDLLRACKDGARRGLILAGPLGIGKSALLRDALATAKSLGLPAAAIRALGTSDITAADLILDVLNQLDELPADYNASFPQHGPLFHILDRSRGSLLVVLEDMDLLPPEAATLFFEGLRRVTRPLAVLGSLTRRTSSTAPSSSGDLWYDFVSLPPLASDDVAALAASYLKGPTVPSVGEDLAQASRGNPLFALELLRTWRFSEVLTEVAGYWCWSDGAPPETIPDTIADAVGVRVDELDEKERATLLALVLLSRPASLDELRVILRGARSTDLISRLSEQGFIAESRSPHLTYEIVQPAYAEAVKRRTSETAIAAMHGIIYESLVELSHSNPLELAHHGSLALVEPDMLNHTISAAAEAARTAHKYPQAARWYGHLARTHDLPPLERIDLLLSQADSETTFDPTRAVQTFSLALEEASDEDVKARALAGRARAYRRLGRHDAMRRDLDAAKLIVQDKFLDFEINHALAIHAGIERRFTEAEDRLNALRTRHIDDEQQAKVMGHLAQVAYASGDVRTAARRAETALGLSRDSEQQAFLGSNLGWYLVILGDWQTAGSLLDERGNIAESSGDIWTLANVRCDQARLHAWRGKVPTGLEFATEAMRLSRLLDSMVDRIHSLEAFGTSLLEAGDFPGAVQAFRDSLDLIRMNVEPRDLVLNHTQLATAYLRLGKLALAEETIERAREHLVDAPALEILVERARAELLYRQGRSNAALDICDRWVARSSSFRFGQAWLLETSARVLDLTGNRSLCRTRANEAINMYKLLGAASRSGALATWVAQRAPKRIGRPPSSLPYGLTKREVEVLWMTTQGKTAREAASALFLSEGTVRKHLENIKLKAGVSRKAELVTFAARLGITPDSVPDALNDAHPDATGAAN